jgi:hypothetical protein
MTMYQSYLARRWWLGVFLFACVLTLVNCGKSDGGGGGGGTNAETPNTCGTGYLYANQQLGCLTTNGCNAQETQVYWQNTCVRVADINNPQSSWYYGNYGQNGQYGGQIPYNNYGVYTYGNPFYGSGGNPYNYGGYNPGYYGGGGFYGGGYIRLGY